MSADCDGLGVPAVEAAVPAVAPAAVLAHAAVGCLVPQLESPTM